MKVGDTIFLPRKVHHAFVQLREEAKMIVSYLLAGKMEDLFAVIDKWTSLLTKEEITKVFAGNEMQVAKASL